MTALAAPVEGSSRAGVRSRAVAIDVTPDAVFGTLHEPASGSVASTAVLICPPWGWEEITSYRARRAWAERLASAGRLVLRIDLPGTGDSGGSPQDPDRVGAWRGAIDAAASAVAARPGIERVVAIGMGLGGLLTCAALDDGAPIDALVLWALPAAGRAWLREQRAFAALQAARADRIERHVDESGASIEDVSAPVAAEPGTMEIGGFALSEATVEDLRSLDVATMALDRARHVLLLDRDGVDRSAGLAARLTERGVDVQTGAGEGWERMVFHPERYAEPDGVFATVDAWLAGIELGPSPAGRSGSPGRSPAGAPRLLDALTTTSGEVQIRETAVRIERPFGTLFGILAEPATRTNDLAAVFLNAGAVRRVGPNRMWVETARRWAARGIPTLRVDLEGIGDADGEPARYADVNLFYRPEFGANVGAILDDLERRGVARRFALVGLCAGAYWAFHRAADDPRVIAALILNPRAMIWDDGLLARREARKVGRLLTASTWLEVARGEIGLRRAVPIAGAVARTAVAAAGRASARLVRRNRPAAADDLVRARLGQLGAAGTRVVLAFSGDEPVHDELEEAGFLDELDRWPNMELVTLPGRDHTLRPLVAQRAAMALLDAELDRLLAPERA